MGDTPVRKMKKMKMKWLKVNKKKGRMKGLKVNLKKG